MKTVDVWKELPDMIDALFAGNHDKPGGWVIMKVNDKGRACVEALFPLAHIAWGDDDDPALKTFEINLPRAVAATETKLPLEIGADLDEANPDQLAMLLALGVGEQGGRAAIIRDGRLEIFQWGDDHRTWH